jgi:hypothetical protein
VEVVAALAIVALFGSQLLWMWFVSGRDVAARNERRELQNRIQRPDLIITSDPTEGPPDEDLREVIPADDEYNQVGMILDTGEANGTDPDARH